MSAEAEFDDVSTMDGLAVHIHEWFMSLIRGGFTEDQALRLLSDQIGRAQAEASGDPA